MDGMVFDEDGEKGVPPGREQISALDAHLEKTQNTHGPYILVLR